MERTRYGRLEMCSEIGKQSARGRHRITYPRLLRHQVFAVEVMRWDLQCGVQEAEAFGIVGNV